MIYVGMVIAESAFREPLPLVLVGFPLHPQWISRDTCDVVHGAGGTYVRHGLYLAGPGISALECASQSIRVRLTPGISAPATRASYFVNQRLDGCRSEERRVGNECVSTCRSR